MKIITLVENTCGNPQCIAEHGLSIYAETNKHRLLLDTGQTDALLHNAAILGIPLEKVDTVILSHGHYDHSGGILPFCRINQSAKIIMQKNAPEPHYNGERYIGIDSSIPTLDRTILINGDLQIDEELFLFSGIKGRRCYPQGNKKLLSIKNAQKIQDDFSHEQCLVISQDNKKWLLSGCAHNGILNILDRYYQLFGNYPDYTITGFHMMKREGDYTPEEKNIIIKTAEELSHLKTIFYSGHCTGIPGFEMMKAIMNDQLIAMHTGEYIIS